LRDTTQPLPTIYQRLIWFTHNRCWKFLALLVYRITKPAVNFLHYGSSIRSDITWGIDGQQNTFHIQNREHEIDRPLADRNRHFRDIRIPASRRLGLFIHTHGTWLVTRGVEILEKNEAGTAGQKATHKPASFLTFQLLRN
jgi:hypothetical protein